MSIQKAATWITSIGSAVAVIVTGLAWAWNVHNAFLMEQLTPLLRGVYAQRINNYRAKECRGDYSNSEDLADAMADYEELVGRPISDRDCSTLL